ncbi:uncharacterized protein CELE_Y25C1A.14 [Caenorhabditis elegans]|nr:Uncharacterized protein CELE_Y25C1A.14 [Caenorhabditis elegans]CAH2172147.1 Uncharacterized protein CELE_Y25C1A.14 [Caenorhabditis elegans]
MLFLCLFLLTARSSGLLQFPRLQVHNQLVLLHNVVARHDVQMLLAIFETTDEDLPYAPDLINASKTVWISINSAEFTPNSEILANLSFRLPPSNKKYEHQWLMSSSPSSPSGWKISGVEHFTWCYVGIFKCVVEVLSGFQNQI